LGVNKVLNMNTLTDAHLSEDFQEYFLPWYHLGMVDPVTRRVERPLAFASDVKFYERLMFEAISFMVHDGDLGLCLFEQAYELARDSESLGLAECLLAAEELNNRGFSELAFPMFAEIAKRALAENDLPILRSLMFPLSQCGRLVRLEARDLIELIEAEHPGLRLPAKPKRKAKRSS